MGKWKNLGLGLILMLFILSFAVTVVLNFRPLYYGDIQRLDLEAVSGLSKEEIQENYDVLIDYNNFWGPDRLELPGLAMSESGRVHFEEVKVIFVTLEYICLVTFVLGLAGIFWFRKQGEIRYLKYTSIMTAAIPAVLGMGIAISWDRAFVIFHKIFFRNDFWIFDAVSDPVITILPDTYFLHCAVLILLLVIGGSLICGLLYRRQKRKEKRGEQHCAECNE